MLTVGASAGAWAAVYVVSSIVVGQAGGACPALGGDRLVVLVPAVLSFIGAVIVAFWNRPERRVRRRR